LKTSIFLFPTFGVVSSPTDVLSTVFLFVLLSLVGSRTTRTALELPEERPDVNVIWHVRPTGGDCFDVGRGADSLRDLVWKRIRCRFSFFHLLILGFLDSSFVRRRCERVGPSSRKTLRYALAKVAFRVISHRLFVSFKALLCLFRHSVIGNPSQLDLLCVRRRR